MGVGKSHARRHTRKPCGGAQDKPPSKRYALDVRLVDEATSQDHITPSLAKRGNQSINILGAMLTVRVERDDEPGIRSRQGMGNSRLQRSSLSQIAAMSQDLNRVLRRDLRRAVGRSVVNNDDVIGSVGEVTERVGDNALLVECSDDNGSHHGVRRIHCPGRFVCRTAPAYLAIRII